MKQEEAEFHSLKQSLILDTQIYLAALTNLTFENYIDPDYYSRLVLLKNQLLSNSINLGAYRFKACLSFLHDKQPGNQLR